jgi:hypothetical protein
MFARPLDGPIKFLGASPVTLDEAFAGESSTAGGSKLDEAKTWLADYLKGGSKRATDVSAAAEAQGISPATLRRAKTGLSIETKKDGNRTRRTTGHYPLAPHRRLR